MAKVNRGLSLDPDVSTALDELFTQTLMPHSHLFSMFIDALTNGFGRWTFTNYFSKATGYGWVMQLPHDSPARALTLVLTIDHKSGRWLVRKIWREQEFSAGHTLDAKRGAWVPITEAGP